MPPGGITTRIAELREVDEVAPVERQLHDFAVLDDVADFGVGRLQQRRRRLDDDLLGHALHAEREIERQRSADLEGERLLLGGEATQGRGDLPPADAERGKEVAPVRVGDALDHRAARRVGRGDGGPREAPRPTRRARTANLTGVELSERDRSVEQAQQQCCG